MASGAKMTVFVVDVGQAMEHNLVSTGRAISASLTAKIAESLVPKETAIVLFGSKPNSQDQPVASDGTTKIAHTMQPPSAKEIATVRNLANPTKPLSGTHFIEALEAVLEEPKMAELQELAAQAIAAHKSPRSVSVKVVLISNFLSPTSVPFERAIKLAQTYQLIGIGMDIVSIDIAQDDAQAAIAGIKQQNLDLLQQMCSIITKAPAIIRHIDNLADVSGMFKPREYGPHAYKTPLWINDTTSIKAKTHGKTSIETTLGTVPCEEDPIMKVFNPETGATETMHVKKEDLIKVRMYHIEEEPDREVPENEHVYAYRYGKESIPIDEAHKSSLLYDAPDDGRQGLRLIGFIPWSSDMNNDANHRLAFLGKASILSSDQGSASVKEPFAQKYANAMSTFVQGLKTRNKAAIIRRVSKGKVSMLIGVPCVGSNGVPDHLILNRWPYLEDIREYVFETFEAGEEDSQPTEQQKKAMRNLINSMALSSQYLDPDTSPNPSIHRLLDYVAEKMVKEQQAQVPETDVLVERLVNIQTPLAATAVDMFPTGAVVRVSNRPIYRIRPGNTLVADFKAMFAQGNYQDAVSQLRKLIQGSLNDVQGQYEPLVDLLVMMRDTCIEYKQAFLFNNHLKALVETYMPSSSTDQGGKHVEFLQMIGERGVTLLNYEQLPEYSAVSPEASEAFLNSLKNLANNNSVKE